VVFTQVLSEELCHCSANK